MKKSLLSILVLMLCMASAVANPVTQDQALQKAKAFLERRGMAAHINLNLVYQGRKQGRQNGVPAKNASYYVFNNGHDDGFVIMAGDDCAEEVLGYADSGSFDAGNIPDNMRAFLEGYVEEIAAARARGVAAADGEATVEVARKVVAPLIETHWNQRDPYNQMCFKPNGVQCVTGCVATALAQVMYYYKWPEGATTAIPEYTSTYGDEFAELPPTTFDWDKMKAVYLNTGEDDEAAEQAVAKLMWYCGHAVEMNYALGESGGYESMIPNALTSYFNYPGNPTWVTRSKYTTEEWDELIYHELKYGRPVLYGADTSGGGGHEFICDGYDGHGLYHINWGWGGLSDGYFRLQALRPTSQGTGGSNDYGGYSLGHDAIVGVCNQVMDMEESATTTSALRTVNFYVKDPTTVDYLPTYGFYNADIYFRYSLSGVQDGIDWGFGLYQDGQLLQYIVVQSNQQLGSGYTYWMDSSLYGLGTNIDDGHYQVMGINRVNGTEEWQPNAGSDLIYIDVEISNGTAIFTNVKKTYTLSIEVTGVEQRFDLGSGVSQVRAYVSNTGDFDYSGSLVLKVNGSWMAEEGVYVPQGGEDFVDFFFPAMTGTVRVDLTDENDILYTNDSFVLNDAPVSSLSISDVKVKNFSDDGSKMYSSLLEGSASVYNASNTNFEGYIILEVDVVSKIEGYSVYYKPVKRQIPVSIMAYEEKTITFSFSDMAVGDMFRYRLTDMSGEVSTSYSSFVNIVPGVVYWKGDGKRYAVAPKSEMTFDNTVAAVSFEDMDDDFDVNQMRFYNPNTICYVSSNVDGFPSNNMVRGGKADDIILLLENYDFFVPKRFFANQIIYTIFDLIGADGKKGWQTISLPFAVEEVTSIYKGKVDWYHGNDTEEKDFWVREFKQVNGNTVKFADVGVWVPNVPYIFAVPGDHWGEQYDLTGSPLEFSATDVWVEKSTVSAVVSDNYEFVGCHGGFSRPETPEGMDEYNELMLKMEDVYVLNDQGSAFIQRSSDWVEKHNLCYFTINKRTIDPPARLNIGAFDETEGICMPQVKTTDGQQVEVYTIDGVKVATVTVSGGKVNLGQLPKGIYVVEGKKIVR